MSTTFCLDCDHRIELRASKLGQRVTCPNCGVQFELISLNPLKLDWTYDGPVANFILFEEVLNDQKLAK